MTNMHVSNCAPACGLHARLLALATACTAKQAPRESGVRGPTISAEHSGGEGAAPLHELAPNSCAEAACVLCHQRDRIAVLVQHGVLVCLLKAQEDGAPATSPHVEGLSVWHAPVKGTYLGVACCMQESSS